MRLKQFVVVGSLAVSLLGLITTAQAKPNPEAILSCGSQHYTVNGFGRGTPLHIVGSSTNYVITYAEVISGPGTGDVIIDVKGQRNKENIVTCTVKSPLSERTFLFKGFFTPNGEAHRPEL